MTEEIRARNPSKLIEICTRLLTATSFELIESVAVSHGKILVGKLVSGSTLILVYTGEASEESLSAGLQEMSDLSPAHDSSSLILMSQERLREEVLQRLRESFPVRLLDITKLGAYIHILEEEKDSTTSPANEEDFVIYGHYRRVDEGNVASADIVVSFAPEGGFVQIEGDAYYGIEDSNGPNIGQLRLVTDDWANDNVLYSEDRIYSAARSGNRVIYETYEFSQAGEGPYRAMFTFTQSGLICEEENGHCAGFGMNVSFAGNYLRGQFDADEDKVPESTVLDLAYGLSGDFRSHRIGSAEVRSWLNQFKTEEQFLMVQLLRQFKFYNNSRVREAMVYLHGKVLSILGQRFNPSGSVIVSACGGPGKSGSSYARIYRQENDLPNNCVVELSKLPEVLNREDSFVDAILFIEDVIGSGQDAVSAITLLEEKCGDVLRAQQIMIVIAGVCGLVDGISVVRSVEPGFPIKVICMDEVEKCFDGEFNMFLSQDDRMAARRIVLDVGSKLRPDKPLGYENSQMLVAFYDNCPNNTVPIIWASPFSGTPIRWAPLFPRV